MRPDSQFQVVAWLIEAGLNDCAISRATAIPRATVRDWRHQGAIRPQARCVSRISCPICSDVDLDGWWYAYLLGLYLGDGTISRARSGVFVLRIVLDKRYRAIIDECIAAIRAVRLHRWRVATVNRIGCIEVCASWKHWPCLFPQHGPGLKHLRRIELASWQLRITNKHPDRLLRGLIHSDGCRFMNHVNGKDYPRYMFTNHSADIGASSASPATSTASRGRSQIGGRSQSHGAAMWPRSTL
jgi:hypothetical protein